jgi:hypothetical protein
MFVNDLFTRHREREPGGEVPLRARGLAIAGDHKLAREAQKLYDYYEDLVTEIQLRASIDGRRSASGTTSRSARGRHPPHEGDRARVGGFAKYLQNQNNRSSRTTTAGRSRTTATSSRGRARGAEGALRGALGHVQRPETKSKADAEYGWRRDAVRVLPPEAARAAVDRIPPLRLDLDFLDTSRIRGAADRVAAVVVDAKDASGDERPYAKLR